MSSRRSRYQQSKFERQPGPFSFPGESDRPTQRQKGPKVVQIPVQFVGSKPMDRSGSAVKIQKVFRGFLIRKNVKRIKDVKKQVDEIEERLMTREVVEFIRNNEKERLKMSEGLMSLLFKLDSVQGFDLGVRVLRKAVTRKAIMLQERVDSILNVDLGEFNEYAEIEGDGDEIKVCEEAEISNQVDNSAMIDDGDGRSEESHEMLIESGEKLENVSNDEETDTIIDVGVDRVLKVCSDNCSDEDILTEETCKGEEISIENDETNKADDWVEVDHERKVKDEDSKGNNELMEKLMKENEKMMSMMTHLFESNEKQMKMLTALSHRVEMMEKAFLCDVQRRKTKKKKSHGCGN